MKGTPIITFLPVLISGTLAHLQNTNFKQRIQKYGKDSLKDVLRLARVSLPSHITLYKTDVELPDAQFKNSPTLGHRLSLCEVFRSDYDAATVEIDYHPLGTGPFTGSQWIDNSMTVTNSLGTQWEKTHRIGTDLNFHGGTLFSYHYSPSHGGSESNSRANTTSVKGVFVCPTGRTCEVATIVFSFNATGSWSKMPVIDFKSLPVDVKWRYKETDLYHHLTKSSKLAIASLAGKTNSLDYLGQKYYSLRDRASNETVKETPPGGETADGIQWPPESVEIDYKQSQSGQETMPLEDFEGSRFTANILVEYDFEDENRTKVKLLDSTKPQ
ncbi:Cupin, RmlC-type [Ophiocordyceps camponoti-floridani]|uniref:Cupin, RmlC-type n=1 Tax=Ophiocordyceps camponoti-floridani TaxID=2030778 RepID=A0A8H4Q0W4_9HYPO|nr:Cupin, RmlC-type [Ophiocordyceps camponoti-floridani]